MTTLIVSIFIIGYLFIALESVTKVNKTAVALFLSVACWVCYMCSFGQYVNGFRLPEFQKYLSTEGLTNSLDSAKQFVDSLFIGHLGDTCETIFFLMGAMTIVEIVDSNGGFNFVRDLLNTKSKKKLLWQIAFATFFISSVLDNLTTSIVMIMILRKLVSDQKERMLYAGIVILAANAGGAFSPIGDVTTIMLWIKGCISSAGVIEHVFLPSVVSIAVPTLFVQTQLNGEITVAEQGNVVAEKHVFSKGERNLVFFIGVGGLVLVPVFRSLSGLPPFMGILLVLSILWIVTELMYRSKNEVDESMKQRVSGILHRIDLSTILFFLGILTAVAALEETGVLHALGGSLDKMSGGNPYIVTGIIGILSSVVDNVPLVASCMGMYNIDPQVFNFAMDGPFWQLLGYCAGVGGSILIIGSAAGVVVMGLEKISFGWYLKHFSWLALLGYFAGMLCYWCVEQIV
ncbi:MAG: sodium:proton antiporter NhaD [Paludibacteraceae bacterium]|jgi:Na+/H+ antiporter NhaD/arsenite permease-like protein|nr:sodium:proton antiporter NhaD [Paludibacteraceae bacterium]